MLCSRSVSNGEEAVAKIKEKHPEADVTTMQLDLSSFKSIYAFAKAYTETKKPLNLLINNAGIMACPKAETSEGFESQFGVNHLGHFLLTTQLLPLLIASGTKSDPSRVVNLSSAANFLFSSADGIDFGDLNAEKSYNSWNRYGDSKLANILFAKELNRRMAEQNHPVISVALHPGVILATNLNQHASAGNMLTMLGAAWNTSGSFSVLAGDTPKSIPAGAATTVFAALSPDVVPGDYYADCNLSTVVHKQALDADVAKKLWEVSEQLVASKKE